MKEHQRPIYYLSTGLVDQAYRALFGPYSTDKVITTRTEKTRKASGKLGIGQLAKVLGLSAEGRLDSESKGGHSESAKISESVDDRAFRLLEEAFSSDHIPDIADLGSAAPLQLFYRFNLPVVLERIKKRGESGGSIKILHRSPWLELTGETSEQNWRMPSLLNNLLWGSKKSKGAGMPIAGVLSPLSVTRSGLRILATVQFVIIFHPASPVEVGIHV